MLSAKNWNLSGDRLTETGQLKIWKTLPGLYPIFSCRVSMNLCLQWMNRCTDVLTNHLEVTKSLARCIDLLLDGRGWLAAGWVSRFLCEFWLWLWGVRVFLWLWTGGPPLQCGSWGGKLSGEGCVKCGRGGWAADCMLVRGEANGFRDDGLPICEPMIPLWVKKRLSESQSEMKRAGSSAQSQSSAWRMLSTRSEMQKELYINTMQNNMHCPSPLYYLKNATGKLTWVIGEIYIRPVQTVGNSEALS